MKILFYIIIILILNLAVVSGCTYETEDAENEYPSVHYDNGEINELLFNRVVGFETVFRFDRSYPKVFLNPDAFEPADFLNSDGVVLRLHNDPEHCHFISFYLMQKVRDDRYQVFATHSNSLIGVGFILTSAPLYTRLHAIKKCNDSVSEYQVFDNPDYSSRPMTFKGKRYFICARVLDMSDRWLKIKLNSGDSVISGWLPPEKQWSDPEVYLYD